MQDYGDSPTQGRIIDKYIKLPPETSDADSLMLIKLLEPFDFSSYIQAIRIATEISSRPVQALVVGYGMGSAAAAQRQQTAAEVWLDECAPRRGQALCAVQGPADCRQDHGAAVVAGGRLLAVASNLSLCDAAATVLLVAPHRDWLTERLRGFGERLYSPVDRAASSAAAPHNRSLLMPLLLMPWLAAAAALAVCASQHAYVTSLCSALPRPRNTHTPPVSCSF